MLSADGNEIQNRFDDSIEHFVGILKKTTSALSFNVYTKELVQIYTDYSVNISLPQTLKIKSLMQEMLVESQESSKTLENKYNVPDTCWFKTYTGS